MRNPELTKAGRTLRAYKMALDCVARMAPATDTLIKRAQELELDLEGMMSKSETELVREVAKLRQELWGKQKTCEPDRVTWLKTGAKEKAKAAGDKDWKNRVNQMIHTARDWAVNRKLTAVTKGRHTALDRIKVPAHEWYYSRKADEVYQYDQGNFEAYPAVEAGAHSFSHNHVLKVLPADVLMAEVVKDGKGWKLVKTHKWFQSAASGCLYF